MTHKYDSFDESLFMTLSKTVNPLSLIRKMGMEYFSVFDPIVTFENIFEVNWKVEIEKTNFVEIGMQKIVQNASRIFLKLFYGSPWFWLVDRFCQKFWLVERWEAFQLFYMQMFSVCTISLIRDFRTQNFPGGWPGVQQMVQTRRS